MGRTTSLNSSSSEYDSQPTSSPDAPSAVSAIPHVAGVQREGLLEDGPPLLEPVAVDGLELLHVHQAVTDLHRGVGLLGEDVELVALLHALGLAHLGEVAAEIELLSEGAPLPARDDPGGKTARSGSPHLGAHFFAFFFHSREKYSSAFRVFVSCSPERSTPRPKRKARASAAT